VTSSLPSLLASWVDWVEQRPAWIRQPLLGAALIFAFELSHAGLIGIPIVLIVAAWRQQGEFWPIVLALFVYAPAGGFLGGLCHFVSSPLARLGAVGRFAQRGLASLGYGLVLIFLVLPTLETRSHSHRASLSLPEGVGLAGAIALFGAIGLTYGSTDGPRRQSTNWAFVAGAIAVGTLLVLLMYLAGWTS
jgi:hypothetical protein